MGRLLPVELKEFDATTLDATDQDFGTVLTNPALKFSAFNTGNTDVYIDYAGVVPFRIRVPALGTITFDESTLYFRGIAQEYYLPRGAQLTVTQVTGPSTGGGDIILHLCTRILQ